MEMVGAFFGLPACGHMLSTSSGRTPSSSVSVVPSWQGCQGLAEAAADLLRL